jgi:D-alanine-D-alanine ligase
MAAFSNQLIEKISVIREMSVLSNKLFIWIFIPYRLTEKGLISEHYDHPGIQEDLAKVFSELDLAWKWQPITFENMHAVVEEVAASSQDYTSVIFNHCDGDEDPKYPGTAVIKLLEAKGIIFTGANSIFAHLCSSKIRMKSAFAEAGVTTSPYEVISDISDIQGICDRLGTPLIIKPAQSFGSRGISLDSVVKNDEQVTKQVEQLLSEQDNLQYMIGNIFVERFISGCEFTIFMVGSADRPDNIKIYPPLERVFHSGLPETERFLAYNRYWDKDKEEIGILTEESFCSFRLVCDTLGDKLCELSKRAYCAVGGNGYGRVDVRMDNTSQELFILEVNHNCAISPIPLFEFSDPNATTLGTILHLAGIPFAQLMSDILAETLTVDLFNN